MKGFQKGVSDGKCFCRVMAFGGMFEFLLVFKIVFVGMFVFFQRASSSFFGGNVYFISCSGFSRV